MDFLYPRDRRTGRMVAMWIVGLLAGSSFGILNMLGLNLGSFSLGGFTALNLLQTVGLLWVLYGIWKFKI